MKDEYTKQGKREGGQLKSDKERERYWLLNREKYKYFATVEHMSAFDLDPRAFQRQTRLEFLRVPFGGKAYWAFETEYQLRLFETMGRQRNSKRHSGLA